jgi:response regulator RpfG family c-di-GMP phosphodiesterase
LALRVPLRRKIRAVDIAVILHKDPADVPGQLLLGEESGSHCGRQFSADQTAVRVLVVDDDAAACRLLATILAPPAFDCRTALSGAAALAILRQERFDAVVSDLNMPNMGGMELLAQVRQSHAYVAFLVTTGVDDVAVGVSAMRYGADDYLVKPLHEGAVRASLGNAIYKRRLEREVVTYRRHLEELVAERTGQLQNALLAIEHTYENTLQALGAAIDLRDDATAGHSQRVCLYALEIARRMGWQDEQLKNLARGAYLHDIGKLGIPDGILLKPGALTPEEWKRMRQHPQIGFDLLKGIPFLAPAAEIVLAHHERCDGSGYPRGLRGDEIPPSARIFAVSDTLDAVTSDRPYRRASSFQDARETICGLAGNRLDQEAVDIFLKIPANTWRTIATDQRHLWGRAADPGENVSLIDPPVILGR